jgi:DNA-binding NtrC family response regulator
MSESKQGKILIVDDNEDLLKAAKMYLKRHFAQVDIEKNPEALPGLMNQEDYDVILLDMNFTKEVSSGSEGYYWLEKILQIDPSAVVVLITAYGDVQMAVKAIKAGATDFVLKPWENEKLLATLFSSMRLRESRDQVETLKIKNQEINQAINDFFSILFVKSFLCFCQFFNQKVDAESQKFFKLFLCGFCSPLINLVFDVHFAHVFKNV